MRLLDKLREKVTQHFYAHYRYNGHKIQDDVTAAPALGCSFRKATARLAKKRGSSPQRESCPAHAAQTVADGVHQVWCKDMMNGCRYPLRHEAVEAVLRPEERYRRQTIALRKNPYMAIGSDPLPSTLFFAPLFRSRSSLEKLAGVQLRHLSARLIRDLRPSDKKNPRTIVQ